MQHHGRDFAGEPALRLVPVLEAFERFALIASEALGNEEGPDDIEAFCGFDDGEILVNEFDVSSVFPIELDLDDDPDSFGRVE
jgi:hypothetical protein